MAKFLGKREKKGVSTPDKVHRDASRLPSINAGGRGKNFPRALTTITEKTSNGDNIINADKERFGGINVMLGASNKIEN